LQALISILLLSGCEKDDSTGRGLEFYFLNNYETIENSNEIISGTGIISNKPIIEYNDILFYDSSKYAFTISGSKSDELNKMNWSVSGVAFSLTIDKEIIYSGYFWPGYSSAGCDWIVIDPLNIRQELFVKLRYPWVVETLKNRDPRNDDKIIELLARDNKLI